MKRLVVPVVLVLVALGACHPDDEAPGDCRTTGDHYCAPGEPFGPVASRCPVPGVLVGYGAGVACTFATDRYAARGTRPVT